MTASSNGATGADTGAAAGSVDAGAFGAIGAGPLREPVRAAYIHIPFCIRKCAYCDFASYAGCQDLLPAYADAVCREIAIVSAGMDPALRAPLDSVFLGGGTPSLLEPSDLARILEALASVFSLSPDAEITLEANPGTVDRDRLAGYRRAGCNRISVGVQSMAPHLLETLGRIHRPDEAAAALRLADAAGFRRISADLMFGLPGQSLDDVAATAEAVLALPVSHLSFYSLSLEPGTPFHQRYQDHPELLPDDEAEREQYACLIEAGARAGLRQYEISNAARPGEECRHNLVYWRAEPYFGFGAGAHGYVGGVRRGNVDTIRAYLERMMAADQASADFPAAESAEALTRDGQEKEFMLLGLRLIDGIDARDFERRFGGDPFVRFKSEIAGLVGRGLLERQGSRLRLTRTGLDLANQVFLEFV